MQMWPKRHVHPTCSNIGSNSMLDDRSEGGQPDQADTRPRRSLTWWQLLPDIGPSLLIAQQARPVARIYER